MKLDLIEWKGGKMPIPRGTRVLVLHRNEDIHICEAGYQYASDWSIDLTDSHPGDIIAYKLAPLTGDYEENMYYD